MSMSRALLIGLFLSLGPALYGADEAPFSGPQVGEKLPDFTVRGAFDESAGKELNFVSEADGKPIVLVFVHDVNRQSIGFARILTQYSHGLAKDGVTTGVTFLSEDATEAEATLKRIRHALAPGVPTGISADGREGPGALGLNRNVMLTILVAKEGKVAGNFALVQPSLKVDLPKVLDSIAATTGREAPKLESLEGMQEVPRMAENRGAPSRPGADRPAPAFELRPLLSPVIRKDASIEDVDRASAAVEEFVRKNPDAGREISAIANRIIDAGKLEEYGTPRARDFLRKWSKGFDADGTDATSSVEKAPE